MKCPYCGAEVKGWQCEYCDSVMPGSRGEVPGKDLADSDGVIRERINELCAQFLRDNAEPWEFGCSIYDERLETRIASYTEMNSRIYERLNIPDNIDVYLIHDDTMRKKGKNGFAITSLGFHCRELLEGCVTMSFEEFSKSENIIMRDSTLLANNVPVAYYTGSKKCKAQIEKLLNDIHEYLN